MNERIKNYISHNNITGSFSFFFFLIYGIALVTLNSRTLKTLFMAAIL
jgi:hypothetical protein